MVKYGSFAAERGGAYALTNSVCCDSARTAQGTNFWVPCHGAGAFLWRTARVCVFRGNYKAGCLCSLGLWLLVESHRLPCNHLHILSLLGCYARRAGGARGHVG